jgi:hypothetical protein
MRPIVKVKKIGMLKSENSSTGASTKFSRMSSSLRAESREGIALVAVIVFTLILTILGFSMLMVANNEIALAQKEVNKTKAFYLAEAGLEIFNARLGNGELGSIEETAMGGGSYRVDYYPSYPDPCAVATGTAAGQTKRIKVTASFLAPPYECGIYAGGSGGGAWTLQLRGTGNPGPKSGGEVGGKDIINGNIFVDGDVAMYQESSVHPPLGANPFELEGDVDATGDIDLYDSATVSGDINEGAPLQDPPDLVGMNYALNNTHNVAQIFADAGVTQGKLPMGNELRDVFEINPANMNAECATTAGNDFFLTPSSGFIEGDWKTAPTPLHTGNNRVYYIDGDVWVHSKSTFGFKVDGRVTIVATGNIHLCDNTEYADANSMLGMVALGEYDDSGELVSGGNIYFGDPTTGTLYTCSAMMFAANNFLYNSMAIRTFSAEPESGFTINGSIAALNEVSIERDWYTHGSGWGATARPARYDPATSQWYDAGTGEVLTSTEISSLRHYQMIINYDDRVRNRSTQPPSLPRGVGLIFEGLKNWEELP